MKFKKKIIIIMPVYNDWASLNKLLKNINLQARRMLTDFNILIVNDNSTNKIKVNKKNLDKIKSIEILNLKKNMGNQIAIGIGLKHLSMKKRVNKIIIMDSDGEDSPFQLNKMLDVLKKNKGKFIFASRKKRNENFFLKFLNSIRLVLTMLVTGKYINYGNFSCFDFKNLKKIANKKETFLAYCSSATKLFDIIKVPIEKELRYLGKSKAKFKFLFEHSLNIISVFFIRTILFSILYLLIMFSLASHYFNNLELLIILSILFFLFNCIIFYQYNSQKDVLYYYKYVIKIIKIK